MDASTSRPGHFVDTAAPPTRARGTRHTWANQRAFGHGPESPGTAGRPRDLGPEPESPGRVGRHRGPSGTGLIRRGPLVAPGALEHLRESPGTAVPQPGPRAQSKSPRRAGEHHGPSGSGLRCPGRLVDTARPLTRSHVSQDSWSTPRFFRPGAESRGTAGRPVGPRTRVGLARESWSNPWAL